MSIQILQYEFLGPILLEEWGPPMEKLIYLILSRDKDKFNILYVGNCEKTEDASFFNKHPQHKCWIEHSGSEKSLHLAILPLFEMLSLLIGKNCYFSNQPVHPRPNGSHLLAFHCSG